VPHCGGVVSGAPATGRGCRCGAGRTGPCCIRCRWCAGQR
jgi:hypothetical protein